MGEPGPQLFVIPQGKVHLTSGGHPSVSLSLLHGSALK